MIASARPCTPVPPLNLHGKEGVDGSSPSERAFAQKPCKWAYNVVCGGEISTLRGYETGTLLGLADTRGHARRLAT